MSLTSRAPDLAEILAGADPGDIRSRAAGPAGSLALEARQPSAAAREPG